MKPATTHPEIEPGLTHIEGIFAWLDRPAWTTSIVFTVTPAGERSISIEAMRVDGERVGWRGTACDSFLGELLGGLTGVSRTMAGIDRRRPLTPAQESTPARSAG